MRGVEFDMNNIICHNVIDVTKEGITLKSEKKEIYISFDDCVKNFSSENGKEFCNCVATRDITTLSPNGGIKGIIHQLQSVERN